MCASRCTRQPGACRVRLTCCWPRAGTPIQNVDTAKQVLVVKRGEGKGYAGIVNTLFYGDNCRLVYGDAQAVLVHERVIYWR
jgi:NAD/NADP transhydrogenase beta subunit